MLEVERLKIANYCCMSTHGAHEGLFRRLAIDKDKDEVRTSLAGHGSSRKRLIKLTLSVEYGLILG